MIGAGLAILGAYGVFLLYTAAVFGWRGLTAAPGVRGRTRPRRNARDWLAQAGLEGVSPSEFACVVTALGVVGGLIALALFGAFVPAFVAAAFSASLPIGMYRARRERIRAEAREAWPRMIEEIRLQTGALGRSIPQAVVEVGRRCPTELRPAFDAATREWVLSTEFERMVVVLKNRLADATADATCETLLVAHQLGGGDLDRRLSALLADRRQDLQGRKDARAKQAGVVFARRFVLVVPVGMALAGLSIGTGRSAYQTPLGQTAVAVGLAFVAACWVWASRLLRLPEEQRVFTS